MIKPIKYIIEIFTGLKTVFKHLFKPAVTLEYPEKELVSKNLRGKPVLVHKCVGCGCCIRVCPTGAISFIKKENNSIDYQIDLNKCIICGNCAFYCPHGSIVMSKEYKLATECKNDLILNYKEENIKNANK